jgi:hypothetical protein
MLYQLPYSLHLTPRVTILTHVANRETGVYKRTLRIVRRGEDPTISMTAANSEIDVYRKSRMTSHYED